jgi:hypothetical protein
MADARALFHSDQYIRHNARRLEHLASLNLDLSGKSVLELGAGIGDHSSFYLDRGCTVTAIEPRAENVAIMRSRMREAPSAWDPDRLRVIQAQADAPGVLDDLGTFDVVHCYGLLYHLSHPERLLRDAAAHCRSLMVVETKIRLASHPTTIDEDPDNVTNGIDGRVRLLERGELLRALGQLLPYVYEPAQAVPHEQFPADWSRVPATQWPIRIVVVASRQPIDSPRLVRHLD